MLFIFPLRGEVISWPLTALDLASQRATGLKCVSQLKQTVLAARLWALDYPGQGPTRIQEFTNHLTSPALLSCPANSGHPVATNWAGFDWSWNDYEWLPDADWSDPNAICSRCQVHDTVGRVDGSVHWAGGFRPGWPAIVAAPLGQQATPGSSIQLSARLAPDALLPIYYQWRRHRLSFVTNVTFVVDPEDPNAGSWRTNRQGVFSMTILEHETNASHTIVEAKPEHSDYYSVVASNALGAHASDKSLVWIDPSVAFRATNDYWSALHCVNNLKQIALFGRIWANDHGEILPASFTVMTNAYGLPIFGWPTLLYCRADVTRVAPTDWNGFDFANTSYQLLPVPSPVDETPAATFCRCRVHGFRARADGSVEYQPQFTRIRSEEGRGPELSFEVFGAQRTILEASLDLFEWEHLGSFTTQGTVSVSETSRFPQRFYRLRVE